jgi:hypothetical protein
LECHCIILHGFDSSAKDMVNIEAEIALRLDPTINDSWQFHRISYDWRRKFPTGARQVHDQLKVLEFAGADFTNTIVVGYSMGGIVARQLATLGFPIRNIFTMSSPHCGVNPALPVSLHLAVPVLATITGLISISVVFPMVSITAVALIAMITEIFINGREGVDSMATLSEDLLRLNSHPIDISARHRNQFFAFNYSLDGEVSSGDGLSSTECQQARGLLGAPAFFGESTIKVQDPNSHLQIQPIEMKLVHGTLAQQPPAIANYLDAIVQHMNRMHGVQITWIEHEGNAQNDADEYVEITNFQQSIANIGCWTVRNKDTDYLFTFPECAYILAGQSIRVYTNQIRPRYGGYSFASAQQVWEDSRGSVATLENQSGEIVSVRVAARRPWGIT